MAQLNDVKILTRPEHNLSRRNIDPDALKVLYRLQRAGHRACLVGGSVRDLLLERVPRDFDVGTDATPGEILDLFRNSRIIGRRFPIVHVMFSGGKVVEVSTFRAQGPEEEPVLPLPSDQDSIEEEQRLEAEADDLLTAENGDSQETATDGFPEAPCGDSREEAAPASAPGPGATKDTPTPHRTAREVRRRDRGRHLLTYSRTLDYGSPAEDARRRDLTINGLFYDIADFSVIDYVGGLQDLADGLIRVIGDPDLRFGADPVRMIRALRHSARTDFRIEPATWDAILRHRELLLHCSKARVLEEFYRDLRGGAACRSLELMRESGVLQVLLPELDGFLPEWSPPEPMPLPWRRLQVLDQRIQAGEEFNSAFLISVLLAFPLIEEMRRAEALREERPDYGRMAYRFLKPLTARLGVTRRDTEQVFLICISQRRLAPCAEGKPLPGFLQNKPYFHEALQLFLLDLEARGLPLPELRFAPRGRRSGRRRRPRRSRRRD
jgi:poly(A) polymerase